MANIFFQKLNSGQLMNRKVNILGKSCARKRSVTFLISHTAPIIFFPANRVNLRNIFRQNHGLPNDFQCKDQKR